MGTWYVILTDRKVGIGILNTVYACIKAHVPLNKGVLILIYMHMCLYIYIFFFKPKSNKLAPVIIILAGIL